MMTFASKKLERSRSDRKVAGVCGGVADYFGVSSKLIRLLFLAAFFFTSGVVIPAYLLLAFVIPVEPRELKRGRVSVGEVRLREVVSAARGKVSPPVLDKVDSVYESAEALLPKLNEVNAKRDPELATLKEATLTYFPDTLESYLMLPKTYAETHRLGGGMTPEQKLLDDLSLLETSLERAVGDLYENTISRSSERLQDLAAHFGGDPTREVRRKLEETERRAQDVLPDEALSKVRSIKIAVLAALPQLERGGGLTQDVYNVRQTALSYLPDAVERYAALPKGFAETKRLRNGKTAKETLLEQLELLDDTMQNLMASVYQEDAQGLLIHGRFLEEKFAAHKLDLPTR